MEQVLQETIKVEHSKNLKGVKLPKINFEEVITFQNKEQDHFTDTTKKLETYQKSPIRIATCCNRTKDFMVTNLGPYLKPNFLYHKTILPNPHIKECEISQL